MPGLKSGKASVIIKQLDKRQTQALIEAVQEAAEEGVAVVVEETMNAKPYPAVDRGKLVESWKHRNKRNGAMILSSRRQAAIMEEGARPFNPRYKEIAGWVARKLDLPRSYVKDAEPIFKNMGKRKQRATPKEDSDELKRRARGENRKKQLVIFAAIVAGTMAKIRKKGIEPRGIATKSLPKLTAKAMQKIDLKLNQIR